jgi:hypothetical protein
LKVKLKLREIAELSADDPKLAILNALGSRMDDFEVFGNLVLCATYISPNRTAGGLWLPDTSEDRFQGKAYLVLSLGPLAFVDDNIAQFGPYARGGDKEIKPGEWVIGNPSDGYELFGVKDGEGVSCRLFEDTRIKGRVKHPGSVY